ncbi:MAG TPA: SDR family oxidoreductase [Candidatus Limnocylindria bacterium]|jgi:L-fucose dehydrogenase|nr:SDR family oxidoreductase [Candidatus Limnocylindria bacterium]
MNLELAGRAVLISGAAHGIGAATARAFAAEGARVALVDRDEDAGQSLAAELPGSVFIAADLTDDAACERAVAETVRAFGQLDILVNNAGVNDSVPLSAPPANFLASLRRNLLHVFALTHFAAPHLGAARGAVVSVSSKVAVTGQGSTSGYAAAKGAVNALTREWALALAPKGVRVNAVVPAECDTEQYRRWFAAQPDPAATRAEVAGRVPLGHRLTTPAEIADAIVWLASPRAGHITGQLLYVDGGYTHLDRAATAGIAHWG